MTIRVFPSRLEGEPLETHETQDVVSVTDWLVENVKGYDATIEPQFSVTINGARVGPQEFPLTQFSADDDVQIHIEARAVGAVATWAYYVVIAVLIVSMYMMSKNQASASQRQGKTLADPGDLANRRRYGEPVREIAGSPIVFPDYLNPPRRHYPSPTEQWIEMLLCVGVGSYEKTLENVYIGDTPVTALAGTVDVRFYEPGEDLSGEVAAQWWHSPEEVGFTSFGNAGLTLGAGQGGEAIWAATLAFGNSTIIGGAPYPDSWGIGTALRIEAEHPVTFGTNWVASPLLDALGITDADSVEITGTNEGVFDVIAVIPPSASAAGTPSSVVASDPVARLNFATTPASLGITLGTTVFSVLMTQTMASVDELVVAMNAQLNATPVRVSAAANELTLLQMTPYNGEPFVLAGDVTLFMGADPDYSTGTAPVISNATRYALAGAVFVPAVEITAVGREGLRYVIDTTPATQAMTVYPEGMTAAWAGFPDTTVSRESSVSLAGADVSSGNTKWHGWFSAVPLGEDCDAFEIDIFHPNGLISYSSKGHARNQYAGGVIEWRYVGETAIQQVPFGKTMASPDQMGFTYRVALPQPGRIEVRVAADGIPSTSTTTMDKQQWAGLRARIIDAPTQYDGVTVMAVRLRSGDRISGAVENKISLRATRILPTIEDPDISESTRAIAPYFAYMLSTVGYGRDKIDMDSLTMLHDLWAERRDTFDIAFESSGTLKTAANICLNAGFAELTLRSGKVVPVRDGPTMGFPTRVYMPADYTKPLIEQTEAVQPDDIDGVDADYVDFNTGRTLTVQYRLEGDIGRRVEKISTPGVTSATRAWRIAARRRRIAAYRRTQYSGGTELQAMNSHYLDHVGLQDGIPYYGQSAFVLGVDGNTLILSEEIKPVDGDMLAVMRKQDGTATRPENVFATGNRLTFTTGLPFAPNVGDDAARATMVLVGGSETIVHEALITQIKPTANGRVDFVAVNYDDRVYLDDDSGLNSVFLTSLVYKTACDTSQVYPLEFGDMFGVAHTAVDAFGLTFMPELFAIGHTTPGVTIEGATKYTDYTNWAPERFSVAHIAPVVVIESGTKYTNYTNWTPERFALSAVSPGVVVTTTVKYIEYRDWEPERFSLAHTQPGVTIATRP